jgi:hypothetical protein
MLCAASQLLFVDDASSLASVTAAFGLMAGDGSQQRLTGIPPADNATAAETIPDSTCTPQTPRHWEGASSSTDPLTHVHMAMRETIKEPGTSP